MVPQDSLQKCFLVGEILVECSNGDASPARHSCGRQLFLSHIAQNLNSGFQNRVYAGSRTSLNGQFARLEHNFWTSGQMRTPNLKLDSSKHLTLKREEKFRRALRMTIPDQLGGTYNFPNSKVTINRMGYGAMQLAGPHVWGPPRDRNQAIAVLREAIGTGVNHIDTSDYYGPHVTNQIIKEALHP